MEQTVKTVTGVLLTGVGTAFSIVGTTILRDCGKNYNTLLTEIAGKLFKKGA